MSFKEIKGDLFELASNGEFDVIAQGCNCFNTQKSGIAVEFVKRFGTNKFTMELIGKGDKSKLGLIDYQKTTINWKPIYVVNCYTQYRYGRDKKYFDEDAFTNCMKQINELFKFKKIGLPAIGAGLAGGDINVIKQIMKDELKNCDVTLVIKE